MREHVDHLIRLAEARRIIKRFLYQRARQTEAVRTGGLSIDEVDRLDDRAERWLKGERRRRGQ